MKIAVVTPSHDVRHLSEAWASLKMQSVKDWVWVVMVNDPKGDVDNLDKMTRQVSAMVTDESGEQDNRVVIYGDKMALSASQGVGLRKRAAFMTAIQDVKADVLVELDHDDLLVPTALQEIGKAFADEEVDFFYSDAAYFEPDGKPQGTPSYMRPDVRKAWQNNGFEFYVADIEGVRPGKYVCPVAFEPSPVSFSLVYWAPDHVRVWRSSFYERVGGHNAELELCDDHDLLCKTFVHARKMVHHAAPLYLYRHWDSNTWAAKVDRIRQLTYQNENRWIEAMAAAHCKRSGLLAIDLGGLHDGPGAPWVPVDGDMRVRALPGGVQADLSERWPFEDGSVGAIRAHDFLEHLSDPMQAMKEAYRVLAPGGLFLTRTPSTDGRGAFQDPTHKSWWNQNSFWYWTRRQQSKYLPPRYQHVRFQPLVLDTWFPSDWHKENKISYVEAHLVALKDGYKGPGEMQ